MEWGCHTRLSSAASTEKISAETDRKEALDGISGDIQRFLRASVRFWKESGRLSIAGIE